MTASAWPTKPLGDLFEIGAGKTMSASARTGDDQVPFLRTSNVFWDRLDLANLDTMSLSPKELADKDLQAGDLLVCEGGEIGRAAIWDGSIERISFQNHLHRLRPRVEAVVPRFYVFYLESAFTQLGIFGGAGNKTTIPNLSSNRLAALEVPHPPEHVQRAIVAALGLIREAVGVHDLATQAAQELKLAAMVSAFSHGLRNEPTEESEIGPVPESWKVVRLGDVREWLQYGTSVHCTPEPGRYPVLRIPNVESGYVNPDDLKYCDLTDDEAEKYMLQPGDLLFIRTNGVIDRLGSCAVYDSDPEGALFASYLIRARLLPEIDPRYVAYFYGSPVGTALIAGRATPASDGKYNLNTGTIDDLPLPLPPTLDEQREIVDVLDAIDSKISLHRQQHDTLNELFRSILFKLMTGETTVDDLELSFVPVDEAQELKEVLA